MSKLVRYEAARAALAEAQRVDEVQDIRNKAAAMAAYAKQAKDTELIGYATKIKLHAERRAGELLREMEKNKGAVPGKTGNKGLPVLDTTPRLADLGVSKMQSSRWQRLADLPDDAFEQRIRSATDKAASVIDSVPRSKAERRAQRERELGQQANCAPDQKIRRHCRGPGMAFRALVTRDWHGSRAG